MKKKWEVQEATFFHSRISRSIGKELWIGPQRKNSTNKQPNLMKKRSRQKKKLPIIGGAYSHHILTINQSSDCFKHNIILSDMKTPTGNQAMQIHFSVLKKTDFGKAVYVVGDAPELGQWVIKSSLKLTWNQGHIWTGQCIISAEIAAIGVQFKYVVGNWENPDFGTLEWEAGEANRKIDPPQSPEPISCNNSWNMDWITLNLLVGPSDCGPVYSVIGSCRELGAWKQPVRLQEKVLPVALAKSLQDSVENANDMKIYSGKFEIYRGKPLIHYYYVKTDCEVAIERHPGRKFEMSKDFNSHRRCLKVGHHAGDTELYETCSFEELNYSQVTENIFLGAYVKTPEDFRQLRKERVTAILSIQTDSDLAAHRLTPDYLCELCEQHGLQLLTYSIEDMNKKDFLSKWTGAVILLRNLLRYGNRVYVHCSAGVYRSPQIVALYLMLVNHISPSQAVEFVKKRHPFARPNQDLINSAYEMVTKRAHLQPQTHI